MKMIISFITVISVFLTGCTGELFVLKPEGDEAKIALKQGPVIEGKLLAINTQERVLYTELTSGGDKIGTYEGERIVGLPVDSLQSVTIQHYVNKSWLMPWVVTQVIPPILLGIAAAEVGAETPLKGILVFSVPAFTSGIFLAFFSPDPPQIQGDLSSDRLEKLNVYTRFPLGLNTGQLHRIASLHGQQVVRILWVKKAELL